MVCLKCITGYNSRRQLFDCLGHGVAKIIQPLPVQSTVEGGADFSAGQSEFDVIHLVDHRVLVVSQSVCNRSTKYQKETDSDDCEDNTDGAKNSFGWRDNRDFLCEIQGFDGRIQRRDGTISLLGLLGFTRHGRNAK